MDNYGSKYTGIYRLNAGAFVNSLSGVGDTLSLTGLISDTGDLKNARVAYNRFVGNRGVNIGVSGSYTEYELGEELKTLEAKGDTKHLSAYLSYPIIKTRAHTLDTSLTYDHKKLRDQTFATDSKKQTDSLTLALTNNINTSWLDRYGAFFATASITYGDLKLKRDDARANDTTLQSKGNYSKLNFEISQMQTFTDKLYLTTSLKAQRSLNKNLDSSESFSAGGAYGVRAYKDSEHSGDKGYIASMELSYILPSVQGINHTLSTFVDHAKVWDNHDRLPGADTNSRILNGIGVGYSASYKDFNLKATLAHGFGPDKEATADGGDADKNLFLVQGLWRF
jgi:hemolysin activation/secretion protein